MRNQHPAPGLSRRDFLHAGTALAITSDILALRVSHSASLPDQPRRSPAVPVTKVKALVFDVFGTVVDWRTSIIAAVKVFAELHHINIDAKHFADSWRAGYAPAMNRVRAGDLPWTNLDGLHRMILDRLLADVGAAGLPEADIENLNRAWHRLTPWPDVVNGLARLKSKFTIAPLSNGNIALMTDLAKYAGLPWDCILGAELVRHYKPDREVYDSAPAYLELKPAEVMMVAAHLQDLRAAKAAGLATGFVSRPLEFGGTRQPDLNADASADVVATDFGDLARQLGA